jgi:hypothetical protein
MPLAILAVLAVLALWWFTRSREIFCLSVRDGELLVVRGRIPGGLLSDIRTAVARPPILRATIRGVAGEHKASLRFSGDVDEGRQQRLRNIFALYPAAQLRNAPAIKQPTVGQLVGIAWIAWLFDRSR